VGSHPPERKKDIEGVRKSLFLWERVFLRNLRGGKPDRFQRRRVWYSRKGNVLVQRKYWDFFLFFGNRGRLQDCRGGWEGRGTVMSIWETKKQGLHSG